MDNSVQMVRATTEFWGQVLGTESRTTTRSSLSTASPWWKAPETSHTTAFDTSAFMWPADWMAMSWPAQMSAKSTTPQNPVELWQRMWLQTPSLPAFGFGAAMQPNLWAAATLKPSWPWQPAASLPAEAPWQPVATAYRTANGYAMATILRTMAHVVEPKPAAPTLADFWPNPFVTRH
jgi:hypothetical protein